MIPPFLHGIEELLRRRRPGKSLPTPGREPGLLHPMAAPLHHPGREPGPPQNSGHHQGKQSAIMHRLQGPKFRTPTPGPIHHPGHMIRHKPHQQDHKGQHQPGSKNPPGFNQFIPNDAVFQQQKSAYQKSLADYMAQNMFQRGNINTDFNTAMYRLGNERNLQQGNIVNDFAGRGMLNSGGVPRALDQYNQDYLNQTTDLNTDKQRNLENLQFQAHSTRNTVQNEIAAARQAAVRRRAQQFGILGG